MIIVMKHGATAAEIDTVVSQVEVHGYKTHLSQGTERTIIGVVGDDRPLENHNFEMLSGVEQVVRILKPFKLASRDFHPENTVFDVRGVTIGGPQLCHRRAMRSGEPQPAPGDRAGRQRSRRRHAARRRIQAAFVPLLVPGAGRGWPGVAGGSTEETGLPIVTEVMSPEAVAWSAIRRHLPARRAEHAEFACSRPWADPHPGHAQAGPDEHRSGVADVGRIHPQRRQLPGDHV